MPAATQNGTCESKFETSQRFGLFDITVSERLAYFQDSVCNDDAVSKLHEALYSGLFIVTRQY